MIICTIDKQPEKHCTIFKYVYLVIMVTIEMCTDEMVRLFPQALQSCSEQVLKVLVDTYSTYICGDNIVLLITLQELSPTNTQCRAYCDLVCTLHCTAVNTRWRSHDIFHKSDWLD